MFKNELCEFYCLGIHKRLTVQKHHVHWLASISNSLSQKKVHVHWLASISTSYFYRYSNFSSTLSVSASSFALCLSISIHVRDCWKNSMVWIRNWCFLCSLEDVIKSCKNPESHIGNERDNIWVYMLLSWILGWAFDIYGLGLLVQIIIFYSFNFWVN